VVHLWNLEKRELITFEKVVTTLVYISLAAQSLKRDGPFAISLIAGKWQGGEGLFILTRDEEKGFGMERW